MLQEHIVQCWRRNAEKRRVDPVSVKGRYDLDDLLTPVFDVNRESVIRVEDVRDSLDCLEESPLPSV